MAPAEIINNLGQTKEVVTGTNKLEVVKGDGQKGKIISTPDGFTFGYEYTSNSGRQMWAGTRYYAYGVGGSLFHELPLTNGEKAIAITEETAALLNRKIGR